MKIFISFVFIFAFLLSAGNAGEFAIPGKGEFESISFVIFNPAKEAQCSVVMEARGTMMIQSSGDWTNDSKAKITCCKPTGEFKITPKDLDSFNRFLLQHPLPTVAPPTPADATKPIPAMFTLITSEGNYPIEPWKDIIDRLCQVKKEPVLR